MAKKSRLNITVTISLRESQYTGELNKWKCTIFGEDRVVTQNRVQFICNGLEEVVDSFSMDEVESFNISASLPIDVLLNGDGTVN